MKTNSPPIYPLFNKTQGQKGQNLFSLRVRKKSAAKSNDAQHWCYSPPLYELGTGYLLPFFEWNIWGLMPTTIIVLVAINQPFTLWMLHSFFLNIPKDMDESAMVDGCTRFQAFWHVIIPVMWPGVITTGLFSFLLAYNDFAVTSMLLSQENETMIPAIAGFLGTVQVEGNVMFAVAAVVSATVPLLFLVMFFQRQIVSGLTTGAVKG